MTADMPVQQATKFELVIDLVTCDVCEYAEGGL
jgi:hypothetical protein